MTELFGTFSPQPASDDPNGFKALAVFDDRRSGGNQNGIIDPGDAVFSALRLWVDKNHNGISEPAEMFRLPAAGLFAINLRYVEDKKVDEFGNAFRLRSTVLGVRPGGYDHRCYDVYLLAEAQ